MLCCNMSTDESWSRKQDFCLPIEPEQKEDKEEEVEEEGEASTRCRRRRGQEEEHDPLTPTVSLCSYYHRGNCSV